MDNNVRSFSYERLFVTCKVYKRCPFASMLETIYSRATSIEKYQGRHGFPRCYISTSIFVPQGEKHWQRKRSVAFFGQGGAYLDFRVI